MCEMLNKSHKISCVCFTGHRKIEQNVAYKIPTLLKKAIREAIELGASKFLAGGAMGFDTIAALCVLELKSEYPNIKLELILPCKNQSKNWDDKSKLVYDMILKNADRVEYLHQTYTSSCMHDRNRRLVDLSDMCIAYCAHSGGSAYTMAYALKEKKEVFNLFDVID